ncbi:ABC transporter ATP-binding protein [Clostridium manihotivorum]|uniref:ABC transporter ATP-binding protein n=1 Tax=Clostridium manihotivorum TaxID=2320868 RepID=A0A410DU17_9CLOT|nr:ABC transporter ATP-binding protein [Clostridium manihotivorum]QAA32557.1 ABC transporter ATP-binding protein [Clostridium manihotivorum]
MRIEIKNLSKKYGSKHALNNIVLEIHQGMFGLLGPNGAGKTTLMRILTTLIKKSDGSITVNDIDITEKSKIRSLVGYLPQDFSIYPSMSVYEAMDYLAILSGIKDRKFRHSRISELLKCVNLDKHMKVKFKALSGGMKRRLGIAQALLHDPKILIVDEPTAGLDPEERIRFRNLLCDFAIDRIVILSTHIVEDIEFTCENLAILKDGSVLYQGKVSDLLKKAEGSIWSTTVDRNELETIRKKHTIISTVSEGENIKVRILSDCKPTENSICLKPSVEDAYMKLVKEV